jgi:hypothetical protein
MGQDGDNFSIDLPDGGSGIFLRKGLDIAKCETKLICPSGIVYPPSSRTSEQR